MTKPTPEDQERGYTQCDCGKICLHQAGFEVPLHNCGLCGQWVTNADDFFNVPVEILSK